MRASGLEEGLPVRRDVGAEGDLVAVRGDEQHAASDLSTRQPTQFLKYRHARGRGDREVLPADIAHAVPLFCRLMVRMVWSVQDHRALPIAQALLVHVTLGTLACTR